jgi:hypothetical protein
MVPRIRSVLLGTNRTLSNRYATIALAFGVFVATTAAYAVGAFSVSGGVVFLPLHAAVVGLAAAGWIGSSRDGLVFAWIVVYASLLGPHADHAFLGLSGRSLLDRTAYFFSPDGLVFFAVEGVVLGTVGFVFGTVARWGISSVRGRSVSRTDDR